jgi:hypothetical protein
MRHSIALLKAPLTQDTCSSGRSCHDATGYPPHLRPATGRHLSRPISAPLKAVKPWSIADTPDAILIADQGPLTAA